MTAAGTLLGGLAAIPVALVALGVIGGDDDANGDAVGASVEELARATVQIETFDKQGAGWIGSGSVISSDGMILTAAHLVDQGPDAYDEIRIALADEVSRTPETAYLAEIEAVDYALDLAVLKISSGIDGGAVLDLHLPFVRLGNSDDLSILSRVRILGYPSTGGETLTATSGEISGFTEERGVGDRAWIKTDAAIAGGSSGGMAVNDAGELIGVPLQLGPGSAEAELVDCRPQIADTNGDGLLDEADDCVPLGGFINALRPINLAQPLIQAVEDEVAYEPKLPQPPAPPLTDSAPPMFENLVFSDDAVEGQATRVLSKLEAGSTRICGFWDYRGMVEGMRWDAVWYLDGRRQDDVSYARQTWTFADSGATRVCIDDASGLPEGLYDLVLSVEGSVMIGEAIFVGGDHPDAELRVTNVGERRICGAFISPSGGKRWGGSDLPPDEILLPGDSYTFSLPGDVYDMLAVDCNGDEVDTVFGIELSGGDYELDVPEESE